MVNQYELYENHAVVLLRKRTGKELETLISLEDLSIAQSFSGTWHAMWSPYTKSHYCVGFVRIEGKKVCKHLHRLVTQCPVGLMVDHINHDTLDNRRFNLRVVTNSQNQLNRGPTIRNKSGVKGVNWHKRHQKWCARFAVNGKETHLGYFDQVSDAESALRIAKSQHISSF